MTRHLIQATESLSTLAATYQLSGWQGLYFAAVNSAFRQQFPDPWAIPQGAEIAIPESALEQQAALSLRQAQLEGLEKQVNTLADKQRQLLLAPFGTTGPSAPQAVMSSVIHSVVSTATEAISLLKAPDWRCSHRDHDLLSDALQRWVLGDAEAAASLLSLLTRAARGVPWCLPATNAQAWCDPSCPLFWAKPLILSHLPSAFADARCQRATVSTLLRAHQLTLTQLIRQLRLLRTEVIMEANHLGRLTDGRP
ncbi:hypothetical protein [Halochromatium glycolicum]|uniref:Uncharacterized protein n=1 Tax=Halochromatium glycolicum TaxID=85075 RepID=A0AAJ0XA85_9GAMM|nr:hypothetical protein [Halochromatium glycolicum]MBK1705561.1 hypothetical protein [Halochromatium glycolicum]